MNHSVAIPKEWIGRIIEVFFWDHCKCGETAKILDCRLWGKLISVSEKQIVVRQWEAKDNDDHIALVRSAIYALNPYRCG